VMTVRGARVDDHPDRTVGGRAGVGRQPRVRVGGVRMLTDWERNQLAEIERGLAADFALRRRLRHLIASIEPWGAMGRKRLRRSRNRY